MFGALEPRTVICSVCKKSARETFWGIGFPNWLKISDIFDDQTKANPLLCPECKKSLIEWLNGNAKIILNEKKKEK